MVSIRRKEQERDYSTTDKNTEAEMSVVISKQLSVSSEQKAQSRRQDNEKVVLKSAVLAKALVKLEDGRLEMIVVFHESTRYEFYWVFSVTSFWTPMRAWKKRRTYSRDSGVYKNFQQFVDWYAKMNKASIKFLRISRMKTLVAVLVKTKHESLSSDWSPVVPQELSEASVRLVQAQAYKARKPRGFYFNNRRREFDNAPSQDPNEVYVYADYCDECMSVHAYAHFPNGDKLCKVGKAEMDKNPGFYYVGHNPSAGFRFRYKTVSLVVPDAKILGFWGIPEEVKQ